MKSLVSNDAVPSHSEQTAAASGEYFGAKRRRRKKRRTITFSCHALALGLQLGAQHVRFFSGFISENGQSRLRYGEPGVLHFSLHRSVLRHSESEHKRPQR